MDPYASGLLVSTVQLENRVDDDDRGESTRACNSFAMTGRTRKKNSIDLVYACMRVEVSKLGVNFLLQSTMSLTSQRSNNET